MKRHLAIFGIVLAFLVFVVCQNVQAENPAKDAKDAFAKLVKAAKAKKTVEAKKYITKDGLKELEKEGTLDLMLESLGEMSPNAFKAEVKGNNKVILKMEEKKTTKEGTMSTSATVHMVKEDGQWKMAKPEGSK